MIQNLRQVTEKEIDMVVQTQIPVKSGEHITI